MRPCILSSLLAAALLLTGCEREADKPREEAVSSAPATAPTPAAAKSPDAPRRDEQGGAIAYTLTADGLEPGLAFGMKQAEVVAAAAKTFGPPTGEEHNDECGEGPMDFVNFRGLSLGFQDGRFAGWSLSGKLPDLATAGGLAIRASKSALGGASIGRESTLGPEFDVKGVGGLLDEKEREVIAIWAGLTCQFR